MRRSTAARARLRWAVPCLRALCGAGLAVCLGAILCGPALAGGEQPSKNGSNSAEAHEADPEQVPAPSVRFGLALHMAEEEGQPIVDEQFIQRQLKTANRIFSPYGVAFEIKERHRRRSRHARMETRADRNALAEHLRPHFINVFVVASLRDVDEPDRMRRGVHWHSKPDAPAHYIILSRISFDAVLAHELGHFLGNRRHSKTPGNLMSYQHTKVLPFLDAAQQARMQERIARYLSSKELRALPPPSLADAP